MSKNSNLKKKQQQKKNQHISLNKNSHLIWIELFSSLVVESFGFAFFCNGSRYDFSILNLVNILREIYWFISL